MFKSRRFRLLCSLFALILCFQGFGLSVSASEDVNLVDSDLRNWVNLEPDCSSVTYHTGEDVYQIIFKPQYIDGANTWLRIGAFYSLADFVAGNSYTFNFDLLSLEQLNKLGFSFTESSLYYGFTKYGGELFIGLASYLPSTDSFEFVDGCSFVINGDNYQKFFGRTNQITFELSNISNPVIAIGYYDIYETGNIVSIFFDNVSLTDNTQSKEDGFLAKLFEWFQERFNSISSSFSNLGNKLTDFKNGFIEKITDLKDSFVNKITELKENFALKIDELKQGVINLGDAIIEGIKGLFVPDEQAITDLKLNLDSLMKEHLGIIYTCGDLFKEFLTKAFNIIFEAPDTFGISIPNVSFEVAGTDVPVFSAQSIDFSFMEKPVFKTMYSMYKVALYIFFGGLEVKYALRTYSKVMNN